MGVTMHFGMLGIILVGQFVITLCTHCSAFVAIKINPCGLEGHIVLRYGIYTIFCLLNSINILSSVDLKSF